MTTVKKITLREKEGFFSATLQTHAHRSLYTFRKHWYFYLPFSHANSKQCKHATFHILLPFKDEKNLINQE